MPGENDDSSGKDPSISGGKLNGSTGGKSEITSKGVSTSKTIDFGPSVNDDPYAGLWKRRTDKPKDEKKDDKVDEN